MAVRMWRAVPAVAAAAAIALFVVVRDGGRPPRTGVPSAATTINYGTGVALTAGVLTVAYPLVAFIRIYRTGSTAGLSPVAWLMTTWAAMTWLQYGVVVEDPFQIAANAVMLLGALLVVGRMAALRHVDRRVVFALGGLAVVNFAAMAVGEAGELAATAVVTAVIGGGTVVAVLRSPTTIGVSLGALGVAAAANGAWVAHGVIDDQPVLASVGVVATLLFGGAFLTVLYRRRQVADLDLPAALAIRRAESGDRQVVALSVVVDGGRCVAVEELAANRAWRKSRRSLEHVDQTFRDAVFDALRVGHAAVPGAPNAMLVQVGAAAVFLYVAPEDPEIGRLVSPEEVDYAAVKERERIAAALHDDVLSDVHAANLWLARAATAGGLTASDASMMQQSMRRVTDEIRHIMSGAAPTGGNLTEDLNRLVQAWQNATDGVSVTLFTSATDVATSPAVHQAALSVVKEAVTNALKHAEPTEIAVRVDVAAPGHVGRSPAVVVSVEDNGRGLGDAVARSTVSGLSNMVRRVEDLGGTLEFGSGSGGQGTSMYAVIPEHDVQVVGVQ